MIELHVLPVVFYACLGAIVGSYLNVLILRYNTGRSSGGRSSCMSCLQKLEWYELIPIVSYIALRGRCRTCTSRISFQYPLVEAALLALYVHVYFQEASLVGTAALLLIVTLFLFIVVYDIKHLIIARGPMRALIMFAFLSLFVDTSTLTFVLPDLYDALMGPVLFLFFAGLYVITSGKAVGFGDSKLALAIGMFLGFPEGLSAFMLAFWVGAFTGVLLLASSYIPYVFSYTRKPVGKGEKEGGPSKVYFSYVESSGWNRKSEVPFAPFLALGAFIVYFYHVSVFPLF